MEPQRGKRQMSLEFTNAAHLGGCWVTEEISGRHLSSPRSSPRARPVLVTLVAAVKLSWLRCPARLVPTRREMERAGVMRERDGEGEKGGERGSCPFFVTSAPTPVSLSFAVAPPGRRRGLSFLPEGLQIACQLNHNRDSGDNLAHQDITPRVRRGRNTQGIRIDTR